MPIWSVPLDIVSSSILNIALSVRMFVVFEHVPNETLKSKISGPANQRLSSNERMTAAIGIAKGIQYLHSGIVPGVYGHNLTSSSVLVDQNCVGKIISYNLPVLARLCQQRREWLLQMHPRRFPVYPKGFNKML